MKKRAKNDVDTVYSQYHKSVNMTYAQMLKWARNPLSNKASLIIEKQILVKICLK